jgi:serine/threonine protein kinase
MRLAEILPNIPDTCPLGGANKETIKDNKFIQMFSPLKKKEIYRIGNTDLYVDVNDCYLNEGSFGKVYVAFPMDIETGRLDKTQPVALKRFEYDKDNPNQLQTIKNESHNLQRYFKDVSPVGTAARSSASLRSFDPLYYFFTMQYFDGSPLIIDSDHGAFFNPDLDNLSLRQIISLSREGAAFLQLLHNRTASDPRIIVHSDVKPHNFLLVFVDEEPRLMPVDFGLAVILKNANAAQVTQCGGTPATMAPEALNNRIGPKSDIFSFISVIGALFQQDVYSNRFDNINNCWRLDRPFDISTLLNNFKDPNDPELIREWQTLGIAPDIQKLLCTLLITFSERMGNMEYDKRPDTDSVLFFFSTLEKFLLSYEFSKSLNQEGLNNKRDFYLTQLILLTGDLWDKESGILKTIPSPIIAANARHFAKQQTVNLLVSDLNFQEQPHLCQAVISSHQNNKLTLDTIVAAHNAVVISVTPTPPEANNYHSRQISL